MNASAITAQIATTDLTASTKATRMAKRQSADGTWVVYTRAAQPLVAVRNGADWDVALGERVEGKLVATTVLGTVRTLVEVQALAFTITEEITADPEVVEEVAEVEVAQDEQAEVFSAPVALSAILWVETGRARVTLTPGTSVQLATDPAQTTWTVLANGQRYLATPAAVMAAL